MSLIEWTTETWNPIVGCTKVSEGCRFCYAKAQHDKQHGIFLRTSTANAPQWTEPFDHIQFFDDRLTKPHRWRRPRRIFVNSVSDLFHEHIPVEQIRRIFGVMRECPHHIFQFLTKRSDRLAELAPELLPWPEHVWIGGAVENAAALHRIDHLRQVPASVRWLSCEPLIGYLGRLPLDGITWVVVGGESGPNSRPINPDWVRSVRDQCEAADVAFFFKQWGKATHNPDWPAEKAYWAGRQAEADCEAVQAGKEARKVHVPKGGSLLDGRRHLGYPIDLDAWEAHAASLVQPKARTPLCPWSPARGSGPLGQAVLAVQMEVPVQASSNLAMTSTIAGFDFNAIGDPDKRRAVEQATEKVRNSKREGVKLILDIGQALLAVKDSLDHGLWGKWLEAEFEHDERTAQNYMKVARTFAGVKSETVSLFPQKTLYALASPAVPQELRDAILDRAAEGDIPTFPEVQADIQAAKEAIEATTGAPKNTAEAPSAATAPQPLATAPAQPTKAPSGPAAQASPSQPSAPSTKAMGKGSDAAGELMSVIVDKIGDLLALDDLDAALASIPSAERRVAQRMAEALLLDLTFGAKRSLAEISDLWGTRLVGEDDRRAVGRQLRQLAAEIEAGASER